MVLHGATVHRQHGVIIQDAAAIWGTVAATDREALDRVGVPGQDMEDPERAGRSRHREQIRARAADGDVLVDRKLGAGQVDGLSIERGIEINCVSVVRVSKGLAQRASAAIIRVGNCDGGCVRGDCYCAKQRHANCGTTYRYDFGVHVSCRRDQILQNRAGPSRAKSKMKFAAD